MPFIRPTLTALKIRIEADLSSRLTDSAKPLRRSIITAVSVVMAIVAHTVYGFLEWLAKQLIPITADDETWIRRHASGDGVAPTAATFATGEYTFTGTNGVEIEAGTLLKRSDGIEYEVDVEVTIAGGEAAADITCLTKGKIGNIDERTELSLLSPIAGVDTAGEVAADILNGADEETLESLKSRHLQVRQEPPHGGNAADYEIWGKEVAGVTRVWSWGGVAYLGGGTVGVTFTRDNDESIIPNAGHVADVQAKLDVEAPQGAIVTVFAPVGVPLDFEIDGLDPDDAETRAAVEAELADLIKRSSEPGGTLLLSHIRETISSAAGELDHVVVSPNANVVRAFGELTTMGEVTWT